MRTKITSEAAMLALLRGEIVYHAGLVWGIIRDGVVQPITSALSLQEALLTWTDCEIEVIEPETDKWMTPIEAYQWFRNHMFGNPTTHSMTLESEDRFLWMLESVGDVLKIKSRPDDAWGSISFGRFIGNKFRIPAPVVEDLDPGAALTWLIAHPNDDIVDRMGARWRLSHDLLGVICLDQAGALHEFSTPSQRYRTPKEPIS